MEKTKKRKSARKLFQRTIMIALLFFFMLGMWNVNINLSEYNKRKNISVKYYSVQVGRNVVEAAEPWYDILGIYRLLGGKNNSNKHPLLAFKALNLIGDALLWAFNWLLYAVWWFLSWATALAGMLFDWAINADNLKAIIHQRGIYDAWKIVRDFLNLGFILVLLFSAFSTVFQIEKYHLKKILLMLVLMALLVNFSFPISRFIIDSSNVTMYYLLQQRFPYNFRENSLSAQFVNYTHIVNDFVKPVAKGMSSPDYTKSILVAIVFTFVLMITMIAMAAIMVVRVFALAILIIFSSVGFVAAILPSTKSMADKWWNNLFKYSFVGPTMVFMLIIAFRMMEGMQKTTNSALSQLMRSASNYTPGKSIDVNSLANAGYFFLPIILLWAAILTAQSMGIYGASAAVGWAKRMQLGALKKFSGYNAAQRTYKAYKSRREEAQKTGVANRLGKGLASQLDRVGGLALTKTGFKEARRRYKQDQMREMQRVAELSGINEQATTADLNKLAESGNKYERAAAINELANRGQATSDQLDNVRKAFGETSQVFQQLVGKVKRYDPVAAFQHISDTNKRMEELNTFAQSGQFDVNKINSHSLGNEEFMEILLENNKLGMKDFTNLISDPAKNAALQNSIDQLANHRTDITDDVDKNIQKMYFAQNGRFHDKIKSNANWRAEIGRSINGDTAQRINFSGMSASDINDIITAIGENANPGQYKEAILNIKDASTQRRINKEIQNGNGGANANARVLQNLASHHPELRNIS